MPIMRVHSSLWVKPHWPWLFGDDAANAMWHPQHAIIRRSASPKPGGKVVEDESKRVGVFACFSCKSNGRADLVKFVDASHRWPLANDGLRSTDEILHLIPAWGTRLFREPMQVHSTARIFSGWRIIEVLPKTNPPCQCRIDDAIPVRTRGHK